MTCQEPKHVAEVFKLTIYAYYYALDFISQYIKWLRNKLLDFLQLCASKTDTLIKTYIANNPLCGETVHSDLRRLTVEVFWSHTIRHATVTTPLNKWLAGRRGRYLHYTQPTQELNIHALRGIQIQDSSNGTAADLYLRPHCHRNRLANYIKCTLVQALRLCTSRTADRGSRSIALIFHDHGTKRGWEVRVTPRPLFTTGKDPVPIVQEAGWAPGPVWTGGKNLAPTGIRFPDRPARSQLLYWLRYPAHRKLYGVPKLCTVILVKI